MYLRTGAGDRMRRFLVGKQYTALGTLLQRRGPRQPVAAPSYSLQHLPPILVILVQRGRPGGKVKRLFTRSRLAGPVLERQDRTSQATSLLAPSPLTESWNICWASNSCRVWQAVS